MQSNTTNAEKQTAKVLRISANEIAEQFIGSTIQHDDWEQAGKILSDLADNIVVPETLRDLSQLLSDIADEAERIKPDDEHEAHATESLCELIAEKLMAKYDRHTGRA
jgi:hypothetical protein